MKKKTGAIWAALCVCVSAYESVLNNAEWNLDSDNYIEHEL